MIEMLKTLAMQMEALNLVYEYGQMTVSPPVYPYWVGDYTASESDTEDGLEPATFLLTGFARGKYLDLELQKNTIKNHFKHGVTVITDSGAAVIFYAGSLNIPFDEPDLKKCQINLSVKLWRE